MSHMYHKCKETNFSQISLYVGYTGKVTRWFQTHPILKMEYHDNFASDHCKQNASRDARTETMESAHSSTEGK